MSLINLGHLFIILALIFVGVPIPGLHAEAPPGQNLEQRFEQLQGEVQQLKEDLQRKNQGEELEKVKSEARQATQADDDPDTDLENRIFRFKGLGLQKLNPEISVVGDLLFVGKKTERRRRDESVTDDDAYDSMVRMVGLHFQGYLDPFTRLFVSYPVTEKGTQALGETYLSWAGLRPGLKLTVGQFRQQLATVNRWHKPAQDQTDYPLALRRLFGDGGLGSTGLSMEHQAGNEEGYAHTLHFELTEAKNDFMWGGNRRTRPSILTRSLHFIDLTKDTCLESGLTYLVGWKDEWKVNGLALAQSEPTHTVAFELNATWEPTDRMRYRNVEWRNEIYCTRRTVLAENGSGKMDLNLVGGFSALQTKVSRLHDLGLRVEWFKPDSVATPGSGFSGHAIALGTGDRVFQLSPYWTYQQSPWVKMRFQFDHIEDVPNDLEEQRVTAQLVVALGPHLHERY